MPTPPPPPLGPLAPMSGTPTPFAPGDRAVVAVAQPQDALEAGAVLWIRRVVQDPHGDHVEADTQADPPRRVRVPVHALRRYVGESHADRRRNQQMTQLPAWVNACLRYGVLIGFALLMWRRLPYNKPPERTPPPRQQRIELNRDIKPRSSPILPGSPGTMGE